MAQNPFTIEGLSALSAKQRHHFLLLRLKMASRMTASRDMGP
jgi:hypothetical protein